MSRATKLPHPARNGHDNSRRVPGDKPAWLREGTRYVCAECKAIGVHSTFAAPTALGLHRKQKHGIIGMSHAAINLRKKKRLGRPPGSKNRETALATLPPAEVVEPVQVKRVYTRRNKEPAAFIEGQGEHAINFCPCCKFDLRLLGMVLRMADKLPR